MLMNCVRSVRELTLISKDEINTKEVM